ncbi:hypothetical protein RAK27_18010 [Carnobacterium maltaromaticum]|uniref:Uncharacterized protein n=1 Tax=Carnobacterium maltaromaticum TaxID=2751 RepID=A0AAW9K7H5_CARML|nr:hypothetical protein [Carnobacterium maltaromaticum]
MSKIFHVKKYVDREYTGRSVMFKITYLADYEQKKGYNVFSISPV